MKKSLIFKILYLFLVLIVVAGASVFATNTYLASQVSYGNSNVEDALNGLFRLKENIYNYSADEQVVGKWIDGKDLYRKIFIGTTSNTVQSWKKIGNIPNIDTVVLINGTSKTNNGSCWSINHYRGTNDFISTQINSQGDVSVIVDNSNKVSSPVIIIVYYTKTTATP